MDAELGKQWLVILIIADSVPYWHSLWEEEPPNLPRTVRNIGPGDQPLLAKSVEDFHPILDFSYVMQELKSS